MPNAKLDAILKRLHERVRSQGMKFSAQRECIVRLLYEYREQHFSPEEILALARERCTGASISSVYRILGFLEKEHFVHAMEIGKKGKIYELDVGSHHDHFVCRECGRVTEFYDSEIEVLQERIARSLGARLLSHEMILFGLCKECLEHQPSSG